jgi:chemotaxis protein methyltransferase CheR
MDETEYAFIKSQVYSLIGVDLNCYKSQQMQRRLKTYLLRTGHTNWHDYFHATRNDQPQLRKLKEYLTINVSSFFRDPEKFQYLQATILPRLLSEKPFLNVWSAGCSRGHEPYSLAMMLSQLGGSHRHHYILATDLDDSALEFAKAGGPYIFDEVANVPELQLRRYFRSGQDGYRVVDSLRQLVTFRSHNLLADPIVGTFDLIICRNVVIYFTPEVKERLYKQFYGVLRPGGVLFVGGTEIVSKASELGFETAGISFYRRNHLK